jgi:hypothetical protein
LEKVDCAADSHQTAANILKDDAEAAHDKGRKVYLRKYRPVPDDVEWASKGGVATVSNGEVIPMVRHRITDAGFTDVEVIHLGADKVFVRSLAGLNIVSILDEAREFFSLIFLNWATWEEQATPVQRGAWVRLYGVLLHAWNESFFKLCVFDCGRFLRADNYTVEKDRLDFARILIATSSLNVVKRVERLLVDDTVVEVQVIEEWGYDMGDDACILLEDRVTEGSLCENEEDRCDPDASQEVDKMVADFADGLAKAAVPASHLGEGNRGNRCFNNPLMDEKPGYFGPVLQPVVDPIAVSSDSCDVGVDRVSETVSPLKVYDRPVCARPAAPMLCGVSKGSGCKHAKSCPPRARRPARSGPWSLEWLRDQPYGEAGFVFSSKKGVPQKNRLGESMQREEHKVANKRKATGPLCHALFSLKRIARLPDKDRREVLHILHKNTRRAQGRRDVRSSREGDLKASDGVSTSSGSVNNDWKHWVAMQGDEKKVVEDVVEVGRSLGVSVTPDQANMFRVLSNATKGKQPTPVGSEGGLDVV